MKLWRLQVLHAATLAALALSVHAADDPDPLALQSAPEAKPETAAASPYSLTLEGAVGSVWQRHGLGRDDARRASVDFRYAAALGGNWRVGLSDRLTDVHPTTSGQRSTVNTLREAYVGWQAESADTSFDVGRVNLRHGPAYGYSPTDYLRTGALRVVTTADPVALRETRMGTVVLRGSGQWGDTSTNLTVAPKLASEPDRRPLAGDWGSTNQRNRVLLTAGRRLSERYSGQLLLLGEEDTGAKFGANGTALVSDAAVAYAELSYGRGRTVLDEVLQTGRRSSYGQATLGLTYTLPIKLSLTLEAEYNGGGLTRTDWQRTLDSGPEAYTRYAELTQLSQELGSRRAWLVYATQKDLGMRQLDLTALVRQNAVDHSYLAWVELRYHWPHFDMALQWQRASGNRGTEFETLPPYRQVLQLVGTAYF